MPILHRIIARVAVSKLFKWMGKKGVATEEDKGRFYTIMVDLVEGLLGLAIDDKVEDEVYDELHRDRMKRNIRWVLSKH